MNLIQDPRKWGTGEFMLAVILAAGVFYLYQEGYFTRKGQRQQIDPNAVPPVSTRTGGPQTAPTQLDEATVSNMVSLVYDSYVNHWGLWSPGPINTANNTLMRLNDSELIQVANAYASRYRNDQEPAYRSLSGLLSGEYLYTGDPSWTTRKELVERLARLNLG